MDLIFRGASVIDGTGADAVICDVGVRDGRIFAVGDLSSMPSKRELDVAGMVLCPGFIDIHTHSDVSLLQDPAAESKICQGVTTEVVGNCSLSPFPLAVDRLELHAGLLVGHGGDEVALTWRDLDGYGQRIAETPPAINIATLVGHGAVRIAAMGAEQRQATPDELRTMQQLVAESLDQGAFGFSTGLTVVPSAYGDADEVRELLRVVASRDALHATHARVTAGGSIFGAADEAIATAQDAGARLQFSHAAINEPINWGRASELIARFELAEARGLDVAFDVYPYAASSSPLTQYLPLWVQAGGIDAMRMRLSKASVRAEAERDLAAGWFEGVIPWLWDRVVISSSHPGFEWCVGRSMEEAAAHFGMRPAALTLELCLEYGNAVRAVMHYRTEGDVTEFLTHRLAVVGSDGWALPFEQGQFRPHPRCFGTYPRVLGHYVRGQRKLELVDAVHKMTGAVADRLQMSDRGRIRPGAVADIVVFDPETVIDTATFDEPALRPRGINHVVVNGILVVAGGRQTSARPGQLLRRRT